MRKITTHLWYDKEALEAATFYTSIFPNSKLNRVSTLRNTPSGDCDVVSFILSGQPFMAISAGPHFKFNPAVSFLVQCDSKEEVDRCWTRLSEGGMTYMPLDTYPFSERYGWTTDKYGLSWQIMYAGSQTIIQQITPVLMFVGDVCGKAEEAINFYSSIFKESRIGDIMRYTGEDAPDVEGNIKYGAFALEGQEFAIMDSALDHPFQFNEAISFMVSCEDQAEIDYYWNKLSAIPKAEQCGWLKDQFGLSWQITPTIMQKMMADQDPKRMARVTEAFLQMKKFDLAELRRAFES